MGAIGPSLYLDQLIGKKEVRFRLGWLGRFDGETPYFSYESRLTV